jgi:error-prone DNA polymerase
MSDLFCEHETGALPAYVELHCVSNFSFLRGASFPGELLQRAFELGYEGLAITDECSFSGVVRAYSAWRDLGESRAGFRLLTGSEFHSVDGLHLVLLARNRRGYGQISQLISDARRDTAKGEYHLDRGMLDVFDGSDCLVLWVPPPQIFKDASGPAQACENLLWLAGLFPGRLWISAQLFLGADDLHRVTVLQDLARQTGLPVCASGGVLMHSASRRPLRDTLSAIRLGKPLHTLGFRLPANGQQYLRSRAMLSKLYPSPWLAETVRIAGLCEFSLAELRYEYPRELVPANHTAQSWLRKLTMDGMRQRWPEGAPATVTGIVEKELTLIAELAYQHFFLTVHDIVVFAREQGILCQGRGSAANSAVCYCLGITAVDPARMQLLFERFLSKERDEPPDIDVDFEHERREEVIQYIYRKYGRHRAALAATVICYRRRSAIRDVAKALDMDAGQTERVLHCLRRNSEGQLVFIEDPQLPESLLLRLMWLVGQLIGVPRHLSQHVGGFVISEGPLSQLVPVENAAMPGRTVIQWEKDDLETLGLLKVDVLALGMLTAIRKALALTPLPDGSPMALSDVPPEDALVYDMIGKADTVGIFQIESRAQMSMLPRLRPRNYYDLVIQIAIVRPGPIQGDMVHPYLARRQGREVVTYPNEAVRSVLARTLGVPIFQEQVMQIAMVAAGFSGGEADQLRRAMAAWKRKGGLEPFQQRLVEGMLARGYSEQFAQQIYQQIKGFGDYGFPESHSASFALLAYVSAWFKCHHPAAFACALLNSQPMGFYAPSQLVQDAQRHGVQVLPVDVQHSAYDCTLVGSDERIRSNVRHMAPHSDQGQGQSPGLRLGLRMIKGLSLAGAQALLQARKQGKFRHMADLVRRAGLSVKDRESLAAADALRSLSPDRFRAFWDSAGVEEIPPLFLNRSTGNEDAYQDYGHSAANLNLMLPRPAEAQDIIADYNHTGLSLRRHPLALWRDHLTQYQVLSAASLPDLSDTCRVKVAGLVTCRQRPQTAAGVTFLTLEDESGFINVVVWPQLLDKHYRAVHEAGLLGVTGRLQKSDGVIHVVAQVLVDLSNWLDGMSVASRDFT